MIAQTIQLALAPVFVLVAIASIMNPLSVRLGRVVDRSRELQRLHPETEGEEHDNIVREARSLDQRIAIIGHAFLLLVTSGLFIGLTVVLLFLEEFAGIGLTGVAAGAFIIAVSLLMWALLMFLRETREATRVLRIPEMYLEKDRQL
ncbi:DUF2721 domain-containing protein [Erythrobacter sp. GH3-10]|uniref:DUF2721 domain-containing protein n=2 Tax=Aurantiacibacter rhizosphaerae TaxID=2691582 RepID=A0A844XH20_9SPHN|nr:DUF2721 domain-containing protein [Aurantiacibacter rhizosphaerae]